MEMPRYLFQATYSPEAWAAQIKNPQNRVEVVRPLLERLGGRFESFYYAFGENDNVSLAAVSLTVTSSGAFRSFKTTVLMTAEEGMEAMRRAGEAAGTYRMPGT
jgi:uncharacterized protein with GYD domain